MKEPTTTMLARLVEGYVSNASDSVQNDQNGLGQARFFRDKVIHTYATVGELKGVRPARED